MDIYVGDICRANPGNFVAALRRYREITTFTAYVTMTACDLVKFFSFDTSLEIVYHKTLSDSLYLSVTYYTASNILKSVKAPFDRLRVISYWCFIISVK